MIRDGTPSLRALEFLCEIETDFGEKKGTSGMYFLAKECIDSIKASGMLSGALLTLGATGGSHVNQKRGKSAEILPTPFSRWPEPLKPGGK
ncbi:hypothetical protein KZ773_26790 [Escherichia coli]|nr:hypothetical protein [Escherichia coli]